MFSVVDADGIMPKDFNFREPWVFLNEWFFSLYLNFHDILELTRNIRLNSNEEIG
jgi:hypothetical protein